MSPMMNDTVVSVVESAPRFLGGHPDVAAIWVSGLIALVQLGLIGYGLVQMHLASNTRNKQLAQQDRKLDAQDRKLDAQDRKLDAQDRKTDKLIETLGLQTQALQTLLERTAPAASEGAQA